MRKKCHLGLGLTAFVLVFSVAIAGKISRFVDIVTIDKNYNFAK